MCFSATRRYTNCDRTADVDRPAAHLTRSNTHRQRLAGKTDSGPGHQLNDSTTAFHFDSGGIAWIDTDDRPLSADPQVQVQTAVVDRECQHAKCFRPVRGQNDAIATGLQPGEASLHEVDAACHRRQVYAFGRGAALDV